MNVFVPLSAMVSAVAVQLVVVKSRFCCKANPDADEGHEIMTVLVAVRKTASTGAGGADRCLPTGPAQKIDAISDASKARL